MARNRHDRYQRAERRVKRRFRRAMAALAEDEAASYDTLTQKWAQAFLDFGSETPDNLNCVQHVEYGPVSSDYGRGTEWQAALKVRGKNIAVADVIDQIACGRVPAVVRRAYPDLTRAEWDAVIRLAPMLFLVFDRDVEQPMAT